MTAALRIAVVVPFLDEEEHLGATVRSLVEQERRPDVVLLVDDGSADRSADMARRFAQEHDFIKVVRRERQATADPLLAGGSALAFMWGVDQLAVAPDVVAKVDADVLARPDMLAELERRFVEDPLLGLAGVHLRGLDGVRVRCPPGHVHGATKFYRWTCWRAVGPLPPIVGWDTIDEARAMQAGWRVATFDLPSGDSVHLRSMGSRGGVLRGYRRAGLAAYSYGSSPLMVVLATGNRLRDRPYVLAGLNFLAGWLRAVVLRPPRADPALRAFVRQSQRRRLAALVRRAPP